MEPERLGHGDGLGGPAGLLASAIRSGVRILEHRGGARPGSTRLPCRVPPVPRQHRYAGHASAGAAPASPPLPREAGMIPSGDRARRGAQDCLRCPPTLGPVTLGPPSAPCLADLPVPACPGCPCQRRRPDPQRCRAALSGSLSASLSAAPPAPASPGLRAEPGAAGAGREARNIPGER